MTMQTESALNPRTRVLESTPLPADDSQMGADPLHVRLYFSIKSCCYSSFPSAI
jgi:hypothetical protein